MSEKPRAFRLAPDGDDPLRRETAARTSDGFEILATADPFAAPVDAAAPTPARRLRLFNWLTLFLSAAGGLLLMAAILAIQNFVLGLIRDNPTLGYAALALAALAAIGLLGFLARETASVLRAARIEKLARAVAAARASDDLAEGRRLARDFVSLYAARPETASGRARLDEIDGDLIDGRARLAIVERELLAPLDARARGAVAKAASRVAMVTTISPRALVDVLFVLAASFSLVRAISAIYGGRPGALGFLRIARHVFTHLTITGGVAIGEGLAQQLLGAGVAARLSAKLGEGVVNGMLTARVGLSAIAVCRPMGFEALPAPTLADVAGSLIRPQAA